MQDKLTCLVEAASEEKKKYDQTGIERQTTPDSLFLFGNAQMFVGGLNISHAFDQSPRPVYLDMEKLFLSFSGLSNLFVDIPQYPENII